MQTDWIAVDWGTSNLRAWSMRDDGTILAQAQSDKGMGGLNRDGFEAALLALVTPWLSTERTVQTVACGMVGSRQGWIEAPYRKAPCTPIAETNMVKAPSNDPRLSVSIVSGICQDSPADVMRGEETQIAGFLSQNPDFDGVLCLPGTHCKWVQISAGEIVSFVTFMTGELFAFLSEGSVLRHSVSPDGWDDDAFEEAVSDGISKPQFFAGRLFSLRAASLLQDLSPATARARLSGQLLGIELAAARPYWIGQNVAVIGATSVSHVYSEALRLQGVAPISSDAETMTVAGLSAAHSSLKVTS